MARPHLHLELYDENHPESGVFKFSFEGGGSFTFKFEEGSSLADDNATETSERTLSNASLTEEDANGNEDTQVSHKQISQDVAVQTERSTSNKVFTEGETTAELHKNIEARKPAACAIGQAEPPMNFMQKSFLELRERIRHEGNTSPYFSSRKHGPEEIQEMPVKKPKINSSLGIPQPNLHPEPGSKPTDDKIQAEKPSKPRTLRLKLVSAPNRTAAGSELKTPYRSTTLPIPTAPRKFVPASPRSVFSENPSLSLRTTSQSTGSLAVKSSNSLVNRDTNSRLHGMSRSQGFNVSKEAHPSKSFSFLNSNGQMWSE
jgi:hypothetical protein